MGRLAGIFITLAAAAFFGIDAAAQLKIITQEKLDSIAHPPLSPDAPGLLLEASELNLPDLNDTDEPCKRTVRLTNVSGKEISIDRLTTSCSCVIAVCQTTSLKPGQGTSVRIAYNPAGHFGRFNHRVHIYTSGYRDPSAIIRIKVRVKSDEK